MTEAKVNKITVDELLNKSTSSEEGGPKAGKVVDAPTTKLEAQESKSPEQKKSDITVIFRPTRQVARI